ncbi:MAG: hypothetical protein ABW172_06170 [Candidatus Binatia bacterium]
MREAIEIGYQVFVSDGGGAFGAVRALSTVEAVHSRKVILNRRKLELCLRQAIGHAHDADEFNA